MNIVKTMKAMASVAAVVAVLGMAQQASAIVVIYGESGGVVVGEAETYSRRTNHPDGSFWAVVPLEETPADDPGPVISNARGGQYIQVLPDSSGPNPNPGGAGGPTNPPSIEYDMLINTVGTYRFFARWDNNSINRGASDSFFVDLVQMKDGPGGTIADWYELSQGGDSNFATSPWDAGGGFEQNVAGPANSAMLWTITTPGIYTLRFSEREDGAAIDSFVFQLNNLAAPTGNGPPTSGIIPEPATAMLGLMGLAGLARRRRARA